MVLAVISVVTLLPMSAFAANNEGYDGGQGYAWRGNETVYDSRSFTNRIGTIYQFEGYTIINKYEDCFYVEYSTSSGAKRGYVRHPIDENAMGITRSAVAKVLVNSTIYAGPNPSVNVALGSVSAGELVTIIRKNLVDGREWVFVEYNTTSGRKRGHMLFNNLHGYLEPYRYADLFSYHNAGYDKYISGRMTVYGGPSDQYAVIGYVENENVTVYGEEIIYGLGSTNSDYLYIEYNVPGSGATRKAGYIKA